MKVSHALPGAVIGSLALLAALSAAEVQFVLPPETAAFKPKPGVELALANCAICHSADYISTQPSLSRAQWTASVQKMQQKYGAPIASNQVDRLVDYLV